MFQTGDVLFDRAGFRDDLKERFDPTDKMLVYHPAVVRPACLKQALAVFTGLGFKNVATAIAPENLDMGPLR